MRIAAVFASAVAFIAAGVVPAFAELDTARLEAAVKPLAEKAAGRLGVGVADLGTGETWFLAKGERFPLQSVFKAPLGVAVLRQVDRGRLALEQPVTVKRSDLAMYWSPLADGFGEAEQKTLTLKELVRLAVSQSDNSAADVLMRLIRGPQTIDAMFTEAGIAGIRVDRMERELQPDVVGAPAVPVGETIDRKGWKTVVAAVPADVKKAAFAAYLTEDPRDTSTPEAAVAFLTALDRGELASPASTSTVIRLMTDTPTGATRLKAGLPSGSYLAHKTGSGPDLDGINSASNDIGIATLPGGHKAAIAVFLSGSTLPEAERDAIIADVARAVAAAVH